MDGTAIMKRPQSNIWLQSRLCMINSNKKPSTRFPVALFGTCSKHVHNIFKSFQNVSRMFRNVFGACSEHIANFGTLQNVSDRFGMFWDISIFEL